MKQKYASVPSNDQAFRVGAIIIAIGFLLNLIPSVKAIAEAFWNYYSIDAVTAVMNYVLAITGAVMLADHKRFGLKFPILLLIMGCMICGGENLIVVALILVLISTFAFSFNVKYYYCKKIKTSWVCLLAAILAAIVFIIALTRLPENPTGMEISAFFGALLVYAGIAVIAFFTKPEPGKNLEPITIGKMNLANRNLGYLIGIALITIDFIFVVISNRDILGQALQSGIKQFIVVAYPLIAYIAALYIMFRKCHTRKGWVVAILLMIVYQGSNMLTAISPVMPTMLFFFIFAMTFGFTGNYPESGEKKLTFTVFKIITIACLAVCIFIQGKYMVDYAEECRQYITPLHELKVKAFYPFDDSYMSWIKASIKTFLLMVPSIIKMIGLLLVVLFSGFIKEESVVVHITANAFDKAKAFIRDFCNNVGDRIKTLAKILAKILLIIGLVIATITAIAVIAYILLKLDGDPIVAIFPVKRVISYVIFAIIVIIVLWLQAMILWLIYAAGQASNDLRDINDNTASGNAPEIDYGTDEDLPEL